MDHRRSVRPFTCVPRVLLGLHRKGAADGPAEEPSAAARELESGLRQQLTESLHILQLALLPCVPLPPRSRSQSQSRS